MKNSQSGFTLIEVIISAAILAIFFVGVFQAFSSLYDAIISANQKAIAADLANARFEIIKNMPYSSVGVLGGDPSGVLLSSEIVVRNKISFVVNTTILNVDDPFDGLSGSGDLFPDDYKLVEINITCDLCKNFSPVIITGQVAPASLESAMLRFNKYLT